MTYSYSQISQYLTCPRRYRHRYLDGWQEKEVRAAMLFGRAFEQALAALFRHEDPAAVLFGGGRPVSRCSWLIPRMTPGTVCCNRVFTYWSALSKTVVSKFDSLEAISRFNSPIHSLRATTLSPT